MSALRYRLTPTDGSLKTPMQTFFPSTRLQHYYYNTAFRICQEVLNRNVEKSSLFALSVVLSDLETLVRFFGIIGFIRRGNMIFFIIYISRRVDFSARNGSCFTARNVAFAALGANRGFNDHALRHDFSALAREDTPGSSESS